MAMASASASDSASASQEKMRSTLELTQLKKNDPTQRYLDERVTQLESRENRLLSIQQSVTESHKHLDSIRQSLEEKADQIEHNHHQFCAFQEEQINELKLKEKQVEERIKEVNLREERIKEVDLREEKLAAHQRLVEGLLEKLDLEMKQFENIQKCVGEKLEEINLKEIKLQLAQKCKNTVFESSSGQKRKQQSEGESKKKHKTSGSCFQEQLESMTGAEKMSTAKKADFESATFELRRSSRTLRTTPNHLDGTSEKRHVEFISSKENASSHLDDDKIYGKVYSSHKKVSEEVFHDFARERSPGKFQPGQIWAMYDGRLPRKYAQIKKIQYGLHEYGLHVQSLEPYILTRPRCCGIFEVQAGRTLHSPSSFSHVVKAKSIYKRMFEIYPKKGEVWAIYRNWNADFSCSNDKNSDYDIVEVLNDAVQFTEVTPLVRVSGFKSVFRAPGGQRSNMGHLMIPLVDLGRFRHQIPAFQLTGEKEGKLRGYWELDHAAVPGNT